MPTISVVVPHYDDLDNLRACLVALKDQSLPSEDYEVVVADNGSPAGEAAVRQCCEGLARVVFAPERGAAPARNAGVAASRGRVLAFTDSDCRPARDFLRQGLEALQRCDFAGGAMEVSVRDPRQVTPAEAFELVFAFRNDVNVTRKGFSVTANLFLPKEVFQAVGPFRSGAPEDMDWCARARRLGYRIGYAPGAVVVHPARHSWPELARKWRRLTGEFYILHRQRRFGLLAWLARGPLLLLSIAPHAVRAATAPQLRTWRERTGAIRVLAALRMLRFAWTYQRLLGPI